MKISDSEYSVDEEGTLHLPVVSELFPRLTAHLKEKGLSVGGSHLPGDDINDILIDADIKEVREAVEDFEKNPRNPAG